MAGGFYGADDVEDGFVDLLAADSEFGGEADAMAKDGEDGLFDIVGGDVGAPVEGGIGFGDAHEADGPTGAGTEAMSVTNLNNYRLTAFGAGEIDLESVAYDTQTDSAFLPLGLLEPNTYEVTISSDVASASGLAFVIRRTLAPRATFTR